MPSIKKFSLVEAFNNSQGKTAMPLICGFVITITGCLMCAWSTYSKYGEGLASGSGLVVTGAGLLGIRRFTKDKELLSMESNSNSSESQNQKETV